MRRWPLVALACATLGAAARDSKPRAARHGAPSGYRLVWSDEFDGDSVGAERWTYQTAPAGWVNHELQTYVAGRTPRGAKVAECRGGKLRIHALKEDGRVYSARLYGRRAEGFLHGYVEARIKLPAGRGTWPAWWMMPVAGGRWPACGEIDIMEEVGVRPGRVSSSVHCEAYNHPARTQKTRERALPGNGGGFHVYALEWTEDGLRTLVDGEELLRYPNDHAGDRATWPFDKPFYPILNLAWGGDWGGMEGVDEDALPATMEVDYVRVWQRE